MQTRIVLSVVIGLVMVLIVVLWSPAVRERTRAQVLRNGPCARLQTWAGHVLSNTTLSDHEVKLAIKVIGDRPVCCKDELADVSLDAAAGLPAMTALREARHTVEQGRIAVIEAEKSALRAELARAMAALDAAAADNANLTLSLVRANSQLAALASEVFKEQEAERERQARLAKLPAKLFYIKGGEMNNGVGNEFQVLRWGLFLARQSGRILAVDDAVRKVPTFKHVFEAFNFSRVSGGEDGIWVLDDETAPLLRSRWAALARPLTIVSLDGTQFDRLPTPQLSEFALDWKTDSHARIVAQLSFPQGDPVTDQVEEVNKLGAYDIVTVNDWYTFIVGFHGDQQRWGAFQRPCYQHYSSPSMTAVNIERYNSLLAKIPFNDALLDTARAWVRQTFGSDRVPAAVSFRRNQRDTGGCQSHWFHSQCIRTCYQTAQDLVDIVHEAQRTLTPTPGAEAEGRPQIFVTLMVNPAVLQPTQYQFQPEEVQTMEAAAPTARFECPDSMLASHCSFVEWQIASWADIYYPNFQSTYSAAILALRGSQGQPDSSVHFYT